MNSRRINTYFKKPTRVYIFSGPPKNKIHFYVFCPTCKALKSGKIRVRCHFCKSGAFTVHSDPQNWNDVLDPKQITGLCENSPELCADVSFLQPLNIF